MRDKITEQRIALLHPKVRYDVAKILELAEAKFPKNMAIRVAQGLRTFEEQNGLFAQGRTKPGKVVTKAKGGQSLHNYGLALDFLILHDKDNNGNYEEASWDTMLDFDKDGIIDWQEVVTEFEKVFVHTWQTLLAKYQKGDFIHGTKYVNI